ncbi:hypothetical protein Agub_g11607, partial [Astrephomene gubernaculifera]
MPPGTPTVKKDSSSPSTPSSPARDPGGSDGEQQRPPTSVKVDTHVRLANFRAKVQALGRKSKNGGFEALTDLIAEASINKASLMDSRQASRELVKLLSLPASQRRATTYRDLCETGRNVELPHWHGTDRRQLYVWYHCCQRLRLAEVEEGQAVCRAGEVGDCAYWLLTGTLEEAPPPPPPPPASPPRPTRVTPRQHHPHPQPHAAAAAAAPADPTPATPATAAGEGGPPGSSSGSTGGPSATTDVVPTAVAHINAPHILPHGSSGDSGGGSGKLLARCMVSSGGGGSGSFCLPSAGPPITVPAGAPLTATVAATMAMSRTGRVLTPPMVLSPPGGGGGGGGVRQAARSIRVFERVGQEALLGNPYTTTVKATRRCQLAALSRCDYQAVVAAAAQKSFEGLKAMSCLLATKSARHPSVLADLASLLSVTELFQATDPEFRPELCGLAEFLALPEGTVLFEEGDKVDFSYIVLKGEVALSRYNESRKVLEDIAIVGTGQHFGTLTPQAIAAAVGPSGVSGQQGSGSGSGSGGVGSSSGAAVGGGNFDKKRNFSARCTQPTEFAIVSKLGYQRLIRNQLQKSVAVRLKVLQGMAIMKSASSQNSLSRIATFCQDETFSAGSTVVDPACPPLRLFFVVEGQAKLLWVAEPPTQLPPPVDRLLAERPGPSGSGLSGGTSAATAAAAGGGGGGAGSLGASSSAAGAGAVSSS